MRKEAGFTLQEIMTVVVIIGILGGLMIIPYRKTIERSRWRAARDVLEAVYAGEQVYWTMNGNRYCSPDAGIATPGNPALAPYPCPCTPPAVGDQCFWNSIYVDDPTVGVPIGYSVTVAGGGNGFTAIATRQNPGLDPCLNWSVSINNTRTLGGTPLNGVCP